jgi:hypothetical protein
MAEHQPALRTTPRFPVARTSEQMSEVRDRMGTPTAGSNRQKSCRIGPPMSDGLVIIGKCINVIAASIGMRHKEMPSVNKL